MIRLTFFLCGASLLMLTPILWMARQPEAQSAGRAYVIDYGDGFQVYRQWRDGSGIRRMTHNPDGTTLGGGLAWSPDGRWLAYIEGSLHIVSAGGGARTCLTQTSDLAPTWSPDSNSLVFQSLADRNWDIYVMDLQSMDAPRRLTTHESVDLLPAWSPDGEWIAFASDREGQTDIFRVRPDGSGLRNLTNSGHQYEGQPMWSPDGAWIHYAARIYPEERQDHFERISVDGGSHMVVNGDTRDVIIPSRIPIIDLHFRIAGLVGVGVLTLLASGKLSRWFTSPHGT